MSNCIEARAALRRGLLPGLLAGAMACLHAQDLPPAAAAADAWAANERGNLVALKDSDGHELALFLNTSPRVVRQALEQQGHPHAADDTIALAKGDSLIVDYGLALAPDTLSGIGRLICRQLDSGWDRHLFANYWLGKGDIELSGAQFIGVLLWLKRLRAALPPGADMPPADSGAGPHTVSFYSTPYELSFGSATVYVSPDNRVVGFSDLYNFDPKRWGARPAYYELCVRLVSLLSPRRAAAYRICFGGEDGELGIENWAAEIED